MPPKGKKVAMPEGNIENGAKIFEKECSVCHSKEDQNDKSNAAPHLFKIVGRNAASTNFPFSNAMKKSKKVWDQETLFAYLEAPAKFVPGNKMSYGGVKDK
jgi:cytochrome c